MRRLDALRHLVPRLAAGLRGREQAVLSGVSLLLVDTEWRVRLALVELISGLGANGYLRHEGGQRLVLYLVKQAAIADADVAPQGRKLPQAALVRDVSQKTLDLLSKTCEPMRPVLWPLLFEALTRAEYLPAAPTLCKALGSLATKLAATSPAELVLPVRLNPNLPGHPAIFARLALYLAVPHRWPSLGTHAGALLPLLAPQLSPSLRPLCDSHLAPLAARLAAPGAADADPATYRADTEAFVAAAYDAIAADGDGGPAWLSRRGSHAVSARRARRRRRPRTRLKAALMRQIGLLLCRTNHKALLESAVTRLLDAAKPATDKTDAAAADEEQTGCARPSARRHPSTSMLCSTVSGRPRESTGKGSAAGGFFTSMFSSSSKVERDTRLVRTSPSNLRVTAAALIRLRSYSRLPSLQAHLLPRSRRRSRRRRRPTGAPSPSRRFARPGRAAATGGRRDHDAPADLGRASLRPARRRRARPGHPRRARSDARPPTELPQTPALLGRRRSPRRRRPPPPRRDRRRRPPRRPPSGATRRAVRKLVTALGEQLEAEAAAEVAESDVEAEDLPDEGLDETAAELGVGAAALLISLLGHDGGNARICTTAPPRSPRCSRRRSISRDLPRRRAASSR